MSCKFCSINGLCCVASWCRGFGTRFATRVVVNRDNQTQTELRSGEWFRSRDTAVAESEMVLELLICVCAVQR